ncbi:hypothetical protein ABPG74_000925 [Tetrahymena malaccensis]
MKQNNLNDNDRVFNKNNFFNISSYSTNLQESFGEVQSYQDNQMQLKNYTKSQINAIQYNDNFNDNNNYCKIIYEPEYFLNIPSFNKNDYSNQIIMNEDKSDYDKVFFQQNDEIHFNYSQEHEIPKYSNKQEQLSMTNMRYQQQINNNNFNGYQNTNNQNQYLCFCQNLLEEQSQSMQNQHSFFDQNFQEKVKNGVSSFTNPNQYSQSKIESTQAGNYQTESEIKQDNNKRINNQNILKNIVCAFLKHYKQMKDNNINISELSINQFITFKKQLIRYMKGHSFNYSVVKYLITHRIYKLMLLNFLSNESANWLSQSKVVEKEEVLQKILFLKSCIKDPQLFDQQITS